jgi:DNA-binding response OmpR family regulator
MHKILVAEDDHDIRELIVLTLQFSGFDVTSVEDGAAAVQAAKANNGKFDLILMDVRMPHMTGYEACRRLKETEITKNIPVIFLSAKGQEGEVQTGLDLGAEQYILKPFAPDDLINTVSLILNKD